MNDSTDVDDAASAARRSRSRAFLRRAGVIASWCFVITGYATVFHSVYARADQLPVIAAVLANVWYVLPFSALIGALQGGERKWLWALLAMLASFIFLVAMIFILSWLRSTSMFH